MAFAITLPRIFSQTVTMAGVVNWAMYSATERAGITVVAAFLPAFADAVEMKYGTPIPLAAPIRKDPSSVPGIAVQNRSSRYPTKNISGATTLVLLPNPVFSYGSASPPKKPNTSPKAIITGIAASDTVPRREDSMAKLAG